MAMWLPNSLLMNAALFDDARGSVAQTLPWNDAERFPREVQISQLWL